MGQDKECSNVQLQNAEQNPLTEREQQVLSMAADGQPSVAIAESLDITKRTVTFHLGSVYRKLKSRNRREAVEAARKLDLIDPEK